jgi:CAAX protease family protein
MRAVVLLLAAACGGYLNWQCRRRGLHLSDRLGFRLDRLSVPDFLAGALISAGAMLLILATEWGLGAIQVTGADGSQSALLGRLSSPLMVALTEEVVFRSLILGGLLLMLRNRRAGSVAISALVFGLAHAASPNASVVSVVGNTLGGVVYGLSFVGSGRIWFPLGLHFSWNLMQGPALGFPVSGHALSQTFLQQRDLGPALITGGGYGPEAGLIGMGARFLVIGLVVAWLWLTARTGASSQFPPERESTSRREDRSGALP